MPPTVKPASLEPTPKPYKDFLLIIGVALTVLSKETTALSLPSVELYHTCPS